MELEALLSLERDGWDALCRGEGGAFYGEVMPADGVMVLAHGFLLDRSQVVDSLVDATPWDTYEITEPRRLQVGDDVVAVTYAATAVRGGEEPFRALLTSVYARRDGEWRLVLHQQTPVPAAGE